MKAGVLHSASGAAAMVAIASSCSRAANSAMPTNAAYHSGWCGARRSAWRPVSTARSWSPISAMATDGMGQDVRVVGVQLQRPQELPARALVVVAVEARHAQDAVGPVVAVVELDRLAREIQHLPLGKDPVVPGKAGPFVQVRQREPDVGARAVRVLGDRLLKELARLADRRQVGAPQGAPTAQPEIVRLQVLWLLRLAASSRASSMRPMTVPTMRRTTSSWTAKMAARAQS